MGPGHSDRTALYLTVLDAARRVARRDPVTRDLADDIANDVVLALAVKQRNEPGFVPDNPQAWAAAAATNKIITWKKVQARPPEGRRRAPFETSPGSSSGPTRLAGDTVQVMLRATGVVPVSSEGIQQALATQLLDRLGWTSREVLLMALVAEGLSYDEIADRMGFRNAAVVRTTVYRLRKEAREKAGDPGQWLGSVRGY